MLNISVIQNQHKTIFEIINTKLINAESPQVVKYGVIAVQFLLHSRTEQEWNGTDAETDKAFNMLLNAIVDKR